MCVREGEGCVGGVTVVGVGVPASLSKLVGMGQGQPKYQEA